MLEPRDSFAKTITSSGRTVTDPLSVQLLDRRYLTRTTIWVGIIGTLFIHLVGYVAIPNDLFTTEASEIKNPYREFEIVLDNPVEEEEEKVLKYTQTNPDKPDNEPDEATRFAAQNQQAANETLPDEIDPDNLPSSESEDIFDTKQFLSGSLARPDFAPPPASEHQPEVPPVVSSDPLKKEIPIFGELEENDPDETGVADHELEKLDEAPTNVSSYQDGESEEGDDQKDETQVQEVALKPVPVSSVKPSPKPRPRLSRVAPGPVRNSRAGVSKTGEIGVDAKFSEFGEYMERLIEIVSIRWNSIAEDGSVHESNSVVRLKFMLSKNGEVGDIELMDSTAKAIGIYMCRSAIQSGAPYGPWTEDMIRVFGDSEEVTFAFHYR